MMSKQEFLYTAIYYHTNRPETKRDASNFKKRHQKRCSWKIFRPFLFCDGFSESPFLTYCYMTKAKFWMLVGKLSFLNYKIHLWLWDGPLCDDTVVLAD